eukprot:scaffold32099_cov18-Tisochrysis_lutea.AAC.1
MSSALCVCVCACVLPVICFLAMCVQECLIPFIACLFLLHCQQTNTFPRVQQTVHFICMQLQSTKQAQMTALETRFKRLLSSLGCDDQSSQHWWKVISDSYAEPHRHYHALNHLANMFELLDQADLDGHSRVAVALAIFFHDLVYDAKRKDNEMRSAELFNQFAADLSLERHLINRVCLFIEATIAHAVPAQVHDAHLTLFLDLDLSILGMPPEVYDNYALQIRQEYSHFPDDAYAA